LGLVILLGLGIAKVRIVAQSFVGIVDIAVVFYQKPSTVVPLVVVLFLFRRSSNPILVVSASTKLGARCKGRRRE
jgi:chromate transport protein ChrA